MLDTALAQLRFALSLTLGRPFHLRSLDRLVESVKATRAEFGEVGPDGAAALGGPTLDDETRHTMQLRRFRAQARRAAEGTTHYARLFARLGLDPRRLTAEQIARLPRTPKEALRDHPDAFVRRGAQPVFCAGTTGTTGRPTSVHFSAYELQSMVALSAIAFLLQRRLDADDVVQISTSSRGSIGNIGLAGSCARIGATVSLAGVVEPEQTLALLGERRAIAGKKPRVSALSIYPSYLGELVERGLALGYRPADFGLERILIGGEIVTEGLKARAERLFGPVAFDESYGMTELLPMGGTRCAQDHLHFEPSHGLLEVAGVESGEPAGPGELGTIVATPFLPFRDTTLLLRYDTEDLVRPVAGPLTCELRAQPATTNLLGKRRLAVRHTDGRTAPRDVLEALEAVEAVPLPARCGFSAVPGGVAVEVVTRGDTPAARREIERRLEERGVPLRALALLDDPARLRQPLPLRCDLKEISFSATVANGTRTAPAGEPVDAARGG